MAFDKSAHREWIGKFVQLLDQNLINGGMTLPSLRRLVSRSLGESYLKDVEYYAEVLSVSGYLTKGTYGDYTRASTETLTVEESKKLKAQLEEARNHKELADSLVVKVNTEIEAVRKEMLNSKTILEVVVKNEKGKQIRKVSGVFHSKFPKLVSLAKARKNIFIYGPTGLGKTYICGQLAEALGLRFAFISCTAGMSEGQLTGRLLPTGKSGQFEYVLSEFVDCYENGGVFLLDEIDAADPNVLLVVNAALANGHLALPNRPSKPVAKRHPDFICIAAANTVGTGADRMFSGRNKLDAATLDRFQIGKVILDYDPTVDAKLCPDDTLRTRLLTYRKAVLEHRMERAVSTRFLKDAYDMLQEGWTVNDIDDALFCGWREDEINKVKGTVTPGMATSSSR